MKPHRLPQPATITATARPVPPERTTIWLHERDGVRVRLAVVGPSPLRVELPPTLLDAESDFLWSIRPAAQPQLTALGDGREEWSQEFQLGAFAYGRVRIGFAPITVKAGSEPEREVTAPAFEVRVRSRFDSTDGQPKLDPEKARHEVRVTGIEELPPRPADTPESGGLVIVLAAVGAIALGVGVGLIRRARRKPPPQPPHEWANAEFDQLAVQEPAGAELAERLAAVLREFVARRFGIAAPKLTTAELHAETARAEWPGNGSDELIAMLERCDRAKFAGDVPDADECHTLMTRARQWVSVQSPPAAAGGL